MMSWVFPTPVSPMIWKCCASFRSGNPHHLAQFGRLETDAVALLLPVEFFGRKQLWAAQNPSIFHLLETPDVIRDGEPEHCHEADPPSMKLRAKSPKDPCLRIP